MNAFLSDIYLLATIKVLWEILNEQNVKWLTSCIWVSVHPEDTKQILFISGVLSLVFAGKNRMKHDVIM